jgi:hypothetical protein
MPRDGEPIPRDCLHAGSEPWALLRPTLGEVDCSLPTIREGAIQIHERGEVVLLWCTPGPGGTRGSVQSASSREARRLGLSWDTVRDWKRSLRRNGELRGDALARLKQALFAG